MLTPVMRVMALMTLAADGERTWRLGTRLSLESALEQIEISQRQNETESFDPKWHL